MPHLESNLQGSPRCRALARRADAEDLERVRHLRVAKLPRHPLQSIATQTSSTATLRHCRQMM
jgi:hypothetical protein